MRSGPIRFFRVAFLVLATALLTMAANKPTSLSDARAEIETNLRTPEGKAFDDKLGNDFIANHLAPLRQCKQSAGDDQRSFWILMKLDKDGAVQEILLYPETKMGACARTALLKDKFPAPPRPAYWVGVYMRMSK